MYTLVGVNGNAYCVMGYVVQAMRECDYEKYEIDEYLEKATSSDYDNRLTISQEYIDKCNTKKCLDEDYEEI